jgi:transcriptional regulator with XRE-family HTH domain
MNIDFGTQFFTASYDDWLRASRLKKKGDKKSLAELHRMEKNKLDIKREKMEVKKILKQARLYAGLRQPELAQLTNMYQEKISEYETGKSIPLSYAFLLILKATGRIKKQVLKEHDIARVIKLAWMQTGLNQEEFLDQVNQKFFKDEKEKMWGSQLSQYIQSKIMPRADTFCNLIETSRSLVDQDQDFYCYLTELLNRKKVSNRNPKNILTK